MSKIIVIGAGITGITTAYSLARRGYEVTVLESEPYSAMMTSYANGGQLSVSNSEVWNTWSNLYKATKWTYTKDAPLLINPVPSFDKLSWMSKFFFNTLLNRYKSNTIQTIEMGLRARDLYFAIADEEKINFDLTKKGILHFYKNPSYYNSAIKACELYQTHGLDRKVIDLKEMAEIEPTLASCSDIVGATYTRSDANGDIHNFCSQLADVLAHKYKVKFSYNTTVVDIDKLQSIVAIQTEINNQPKTFIADHVVICAGCYSRKLAKKIGDNVNIYPVKGYSITIPLASKAEEEACPQVSLLDDEAKIVTSKLGKRLRVAGTAELSGYNLDIKHDRIEPLIRWVRTNFPKLSTEHVVPWAGLRPMTPNMLPIVRPSKTPYIWFNTGHGHLGWTLSAATAEIVAELIDQTPNQNFL
jgi:D-amino-acid dehydrogenase